MAEQPRMLEGYRVLDFTQFVAGPTCTRILAEMGAEVIKVEPAPDGDRARTFGLRRNSSSTYYFQHNHSKRSLAIDTHHPRATEIFHQLVRKSDVLVENYAPGVIGRIGLDYETVKRINPRIVMASISMGGQTGPLSSKGGYDFIGQAYAGVTDLIGEPDRPPAMLSLALGDISTGVTTAMAIGFALLYRTATGMGQFIDASLLDNYFHMHELAVPVLSLRPDKFQPKRNGRMYQPSAPYGIFYANGGYVMICVTPHQWPAVCRAMGKAELINDPRFKEERLRVRNRDELTGIVEGWLKTQPSVEAALEALDKERVPCAPILTVQEAMNQPHHRARRTVRRVHDPVMGDFDIPGMPVKFQNWQDRTDVKAPMLGQDNDTILRDLLGMRDEEISALYAQKVLVKAPELDQGASG
jgi:CoA:oxalate CoA-transferase